jgi:hypothetical protein
MPRYIINPRTTRPKTDHLVERLVCELDPSAPEALQPLILERHIPTTKSRHIHVIWDEWEGIPEEDRSAVIIEAYAQVEGEHGVDDITIALGFTPQEALHAGLLPYRVEPARPDDAGRTEYRTAIAEEARHTLLGSKATTLHELRYARREDAHEAVARLTKVLPGSSWDLIRLEDSED